MNKKELIKYSLFYKGEYHQIINAINNKTILTNENKDVDDVLTILDDDYPKCFLDLKYPPLVLYYKGNLDLLKDECIGIVGSRNPCDYAIKATEALVKKNLDKVIVSGLAKGIDAIAQINASKTIGILGCGIDYIYPKCNYDLIKKVEKEGLILSEYPGYHKPYAYHFPFRNRLIASLANIIYIMQSTITSGSMTTVNEALELGKEIRVLPYDIFNNCGISNNHLINEGAILIEQEEIAF